MKDSRRSSSTYTESLFLHVVKSNLLFFFYLAFLSRIFTIHRTAGKGGLYLVLLFTTSPHFTGTQTLAGLLLQRAHLCTQLAARTKRGTLATCYLEFTISTLALVPTVVRKMIKTLVTLGNFSRVLLNLTKRLIFVLFKDSSSLSMFTQLTLIFSLQFTNYGCFSP